ncbi:hypothetical protein PtB15_8B812 [Puccinia triticina]|nr:hypothetical protein PtB15_8B812 [Puccinia triticina]
MTQKRKYSHHLADRWNQRPANKRNRAHSDRYQPQPKHPQQLDQHHPRQPPADPVACARDFERLSLSHQHFPPLKNRTPSGPQEKLPAVDNSRPRRSDTSRDKPPNQPFQDAHQHSTSSHWERPIKTHPEGLAFNRNQQAFPGKSYQFHHGWTEVTKRGIHRSGNNHQTTFRRNPWNSTQPPTSGISQPFTPHSSRSTTILPQRASLLSANRFAVLESPQIDRGPSGKRGVPRQSSAKMAQLPPNQTTLKRQNHSVTIDDDGRQIDIVVDTNILLAYQHFLRALIPLLVPNCRLLVPAAVISELDGQKTRQHLVEVFEAGRCCRQQPMNWLARQATNWLLALVKNDSPSVMLQKLDEETAEVKRNNDADTRILLYAQKLHLQAKSHYPGTVIALLSNDNVLRLRAQNEDICTVAMSDFCHSPRRIISYIRQTQHHRQNPAIPAPLNPSLINHPHPREARPPEPNSNQPTLNLGLPSSENGQFTFTLPLPSTSQPSGSANQSNPPIVPPDSDRQFIFTLPPPPLVGPDQEVDRLKSQILKARPCRSCKSIVASVPHVSSDQIHHYCPMCCEVICQGCMNVTGCDWECSGPFHGNDCQTMKCCATGRAFIWIELLGQLDSCFLMNQYKISFKHGPKITHSYGDEALIQFLSAAYSLLIASGDDDERLGFLRSILISSTLIDVLSQTFLCSPLLSWHFRSELFLSAIKLVQGILERLTRPWEILNSEFLKSNTAVIPPLDHRQHKIIWQKVSEKDNRPNSTGVKVEKLQQSFPGLMADVEEILHNRPPSTSATIRQLLDNAVCVPLCYVLEQLFRLAIEMETQQSGHSVTLPGDIQVTVPLSSKLVCMTSALLDLQVVYESQLRIQTLDTDSNNSPSAGQTREVSQRKEKYASKQQESNGRPRANGVDRNVRKSSNGVASNGKVRDPVDCLEESEDRNTRSKSGIKAAKKAHSTNGSRSTIKGPGHSKSSSSPVTKISNDINELSISSLGSESSDHSSDIVVLN